jgi:hypothetical protein
MKFQFGDGKGYSENMIIEASNLELAVKLFKLEVLWPEQYVSYRTCPGKKRWGKYDKDSPFYHLETDGLPKKLTPEMKIPVFEFVPAPDGEDDQSCPDRLERRIDLDVFDCINVDYGSLNPAKYLPAPTAPGVGDADDEGNALAVIEALGEPLVRSFTSKVQARKTVNAVMKKQHELERLKDQLEGQMSALNKDIEGKRKQLAAMETYLGTNEDIVTLLEGSPAPESEPIYVYQMKLYMDEEVGLINDCFIGSHNEIIEPETIDFTNIEEFDSWICGNYDKFLYKPKSIMAWQVRRNNKDYHEHPLVNSLLNAENKITYFLIRNGSSLYRIYSAVLVPESVFPTQNEWDLFYSSGYMSDREGFIESQMFIMLALQGLIDRTDIFGTNLRGKVDLIKPNGFTPEQISLIRDAETGNLIGDGRPSWWEYVKKNRETITKGTRVLVNCETSYDYKERHRRLRGYDQKYPSPTEIHVVKEVNEDSYYSENFLISYHSNHEVYNNNRSSYDDEYSHINERRVPIWLRLYEMLDIDAITFGDIDYYLHNRLYRKDYLDMLETMKFAWKVKHEEYAAETPFADLVMKMTNCTDEGTVRRAIDWYKLKNSIRRSIAADDKKAFRMVCKRIRNPAYYNVKNRKAPGRAARKQNHRAGVKA